MSREPDEPHLIPVDRILYETASDRLLQVRCVREAGGALGFQCLVDEGDLPSAPRAAVERACEAAFRVVKAWLRARGWREPPDGTGRIGDA